MCFASGGGAAESSHLYVDTPIGSLYCSLQGRHAPSRLSARPVTRQAHIRSSYGVFGQHIQLPPVVGIIAGVTRGGEPDSFEEVIQW